MFINIIKLLLACLVFVSCSKKDNGAAASSSSASEVDYEKVVIGGQTWMKKNLNIAAEGSKCYDDDPVNCEKYGRLYDWETAMKICPKGWHLPSNAEWDALYGFVDGNYNPEDGYSRTAGKYLKANSGWFDYDGMPAGNGEDVHGFAALPGGGVSMDGVFHGAGNSGNWWSVSQDDSSAAYIRGMRYRGDDALSGNTDKVYLNSVRCVK